MADQNIDIRVESTADNSGIESSRKALDKLANISKKIAPLMKGLGKVADGMLKFAGKAVAGITKRTLAFGKQMAGPLGNKILNPLKKISNLGRAIGRIAFYRLIRSGIKALTQAFKEGTEAIYQYQAMMGGGRFTKAMDGFTAGTKELAGNLGALAANILSILAPAISAAIALINALVSAIAALIAVLGGGVFLKASKSTAKFGDKLGGAGGAAKELKKQLIGIDELNVFKDDSGGGGGGGSSGIDYEAMELPDWAQAVKDKIDAGDWNGAGETLADHLNNIVKNWDAEGWGNKIGEKVQHALEFGLGFFRRFDFVTYGSQFALAIQGIFEKINPQDLGAFLAQKFNAIFDFVRGVLSNERFANGGFGAYLGNIVTGWVAEINWDQLVADILLRIGDMFANLKTFCQTVDFNPIREAFSKVNWMAFFADIADAVRLGIAALFYDVLAESEFGTENWRQKMAEKADQFKSEFANKCDEISDKTKEAADYVTNTIDNKGAEAGDTLERHAGRARRVTDQTTHSFRDMTDKVSASTDDMLQVVDDKSDSMILAMDGVGLGAGATAGLFQRWFHQMRNDASTDMNSISSNVSSSMKDVNKNVDKNIDEASSKFSKGIDDMKGKTNFSWSLPHLKLPHFSISGSFSLNPPSVPSFGISWYARGGIVNGASLIGAGEAGKEAIVPLENHTEWLDGVADRIVSAISNDGTAGGNITINLDGKVVYENTLNRLRQETVRTGVNPALA